jgi:hypothetical protein
LVYFPAICKCYGHLINVMAIWYILWPFDKCYGHLIYIMAIW